LISSLTYYPPKVALNPRTCCAPANKYGQLIPPAVIVADSFMKVWNSSIRMTVESGIVPLASTPENVE
jgi:hypothetical protein